jgi:hypothetical protein
VAAAQDGRLGLHSFPASQVIQRGGAYRLPWQLVHEQQ